MRLGTILLLALACGGPPSPHELLLQRTAAASGTYRGRIVRLARVATDPATVVELCGAGSTSEGTLTLERVNESNALPGRWDACSGRYNLGAEALVEPSGLLLITLNTPSPNYFLTVVNATDSGGSLDGELRGLEQFGFDFAQYRYRAEKDNVRRGKIMWPEGDRP